MAVCAAGWLRGGCGCEGGGADVAVAEHAELGGAQVWAAHEGRHAVCVGRGCEGAAEVAVSDVAEARVVRYLERAEELVEEAYLDSANAPHATLLMGMADTYALLARVAGEYLRV